MKIKSIKKEFFEGDVYNLELNSNRIEDDLFWIEGDTGIITHNCFPKDLQGLIYEMNQMGLNPTILNSVQQKNNEVRKERDWESMEGRAIIKDEKPKYYSRQQWINQVQSLKHTKII